MKKILKTLYFGNVLCLLAAIVFITSCKKEVTVTPTYTISPGSGAGNDVVTLTGSNLAGIQSIVFDNGNVPVAFNPEFNTNTAVLFRVPPTANVGQQHIVFTNSNGYQFSVPFTVLAIPSLSSAYPAEWSAGNTVTITGNYLQSVTHVAFSASTDTATIVSTSPTQLVLTMPASSVPNTKLIITNNAGSTTSTFSLINMDQQLIFFTDGYGTNMQDWSWDNSSVSTDFAVSGTQSLKEVFSNGGGQGLSFHWGDTIVISQYQYLSFWVKGGSNDNTITVAPDAMITGSANATSPISIPANVWTYITVPMSQFPNALTFQRFDFQIQGPTGGDQTLYFDNVILVKQ